ncbi:glycosyltransferase family 2 protein [Winogradskyella sp. F6397]|uniref:Glycosyltransferase family 2 protein n=1 Tax=Winogradskyella marina TaxID=2785530 RepID=A0ABS0EEW8_9FLAO|nr:glycosyltransferase family 2 protein [Winogradskyella marina]MBF8148999.1 glycosyltransferase family 2 protein [Winogradskyella marina]
MQPLVSIITPIYNNAKVIEKTISSVLNQTYQNWELLLIDDASIDESVKVITPYVDAHSRIKLVVHKKNKGAAEARNLGSKMATGNYIAFLDADDLWKANKLELQVNQLLSNTTDVSFGSYEWINSENKPLNKKVHALSCLTYDKLLKANYIGNLTGMYNSEKLGKIYTKDLKKRQDWLLWLEALKRSDKPAIGIQETIAYYRITEGSLSSNKTNLLKHNFNVYRKGIGFSFIKSLFYLIQFLFEHLFVKKRLIKPIISK